MNALVTLPTRCPTLIDSLPLPDTPDPVRPAVDVSDIHAVRSQLVNPALATCVYPANPRPPPTTVTRADPVQTPFPRSSTLKALASVLYALVKLPTRRPTLSTTRRLPITRDPVELSTAVSDTHVVLSQADPPTRALTLYPDILPPAMYTIMLADPVEAELLCLNMLSDPLSDENPALTLPPRSPTLTASRPLPVKLATLRQATDVSEYQVVTSQAVQAALTATEYPPDSPILSPCSVTLVEPVVAALGMCTLLTKAVLTDRAALTLPTTCPTLIDTRRLPITPLVVWHATDVSATHSVRSHPLSPALPIAVNEPSPKLAPLNLNITVPVAAALAGSRPLAPPADTENPTVTLPVRCPTVALTRTLPPTPVAARHATDVSEPHELPSHALLPNRADNELDTKPMLAPCTVTLTDPDAALLPARTALKPLDSKVSTTVKVPTCHPALTDTLRLPIAPALSLHCTDVSESHTVSSHPLRCTLAPIV